MSTNPFKGHVIEFHILQSFPVSCLNRDDVGSPKSAMVGGVPRARVSSQCWKRQVRLALHDLGVVHGARTKLISEMVASACRDKGAENEQAKACGDKIEQIFIKKKDDKKPKKAKGTEALEEADADPAQEKTDTLLFLSPKEIALLADAFAQAGFNPDLVITQKDAKKQAKEMAALIGNVAEAVDALDIVLFGRMVAQAAELNVEAAASFAHAISTHKVSSEVEFFTALDDKQTEPGSAHMGSLEFNSATYYRYISLNLGQLYQSLAGQNLADAVEAFTKALFVAVPSARQTTMSGASAWEFAKVLVRKGQRLQVPFEAPIKAKEGGYLQPSIQALSDYLAKKEKLYGSLFGKQGDYTFGEDDTFSIDDLVAALKTHVGA
ncbi:type I-E CRISPR-associated protein Cas7/Cse4/CasC [Methylovulum psychrotolerans]|uniref:CRISPR system Cascade subunit CasC n=1 Tax=Methylovulum psychrotolerans TaxID=1704499 RepID=A0A2S5CIZ1_9GAMM|nr:type I-E CRISPR-associated protein Cas7/Cse4/CasC [Methylovulum psychrotolerans]POZ50712.1 CRISPR system Cascade subunit CasC [Methylovulum psychrotolerans]